MCIILQTTSTAKQKKQDEMATHHEEAPMPLFITTTPGLVPSDGIELKPDLIRVSYLTITI